MASSIKNLNEFSTPPTGNFGGVRIGIVVSEWNEDITKKLLEGAHSELIKYGVWENRIKIITVPGSFELSYGSQLLAENDDIDAVIALGCVIQGETKHDDYINHAVAQGLTSVSLTYGKPVIFGLVTTNNLQQAKDRSGGKHGNKGVEAAVTALKMLQLTHV